MEWTHATTKKEFGLNINDRMTTVLKKGMWKKRDQRQSRGR